VAHIEQPASLSVYRGQSGMGQGEGPGRAVVHGEQFMHVARELYDGELLDAIRPWMTLDSDPADHQRLNDQLEAWSWFPAGNYCFVVRLISAGIYDRRAAYFAHGRAWRRQGLPPGFDPGLHVGRSDAFDPPWRDERPGTRLPDELPSLVRAEQLEAERTTASFFLGHLLQAVVEKYPLIIAAPIAEFATGRSLHALIGFARGGLPAELRADCRIRVYSRFPDLFLRHLGANLVVVPEDAASAALSSRPNATLLNRQGIKFFGKDLESPNYDYASALIERAIKIPQGLTHFTERVRDVPSAETARTLQITYNLAFAFAGPEEHRGKLLREYLPRAAEKLGPGLDWHQLIREREWESFPADVLIDQLLVDATDFSAARRELLRAVEDGAAARKLRVDGRLAGWWSADDSGKAVRLAELLAHEPQLVDEQLAAERIADVPLGRFPQPLLQAVIRAEANTGRLARRAQQSADLARAACDWDVFQLLTDAVSKGRCEPDWARAYVRLASPDILSEAACRWLANGRFFEHAWGNVPRNLLDRLRTLELAPSLASPLRDAALRLDPLEHLEVYLRLADVLARIDPNDPVLTRKLWRALPQMTDSRSRAFLEGIVFDDAWPSVRMEALELRTLLLLGAMFEKDESLNRLYAELDRRMRLDVESASAELVRSGWWYFWRCRSQLRPGDEEDAELLRRSAFVWLSSDTWSDGRQATLEAWNRALADLPSLTGDELARMRDGGGCARWPWIPPFEDEQLLDLISRVDDLGALAELADAVTPDRMTTHDGKPVSESVLALSDFAKDVSTGAFAWLVERRDGVRREVLSLEQSGSLWTRVVHRKEKALEARIEAVTSLFGQELERALAAADNPSLWSDGRFLAKVAHWVQQCGSVEAIGAAALRRIGSRIDGVPDSRPASPSPTLVRQLVEQGFDQVARLLHPERQAAIRADEMSDAIIDAMHANRVEDPAWRRLAAKLKELQPVEERHPLTLLASRIHNKRQSSHDEWLDLAQRGWRTFLTAADVHPELTNALMIPPHPDSPVLPLLRLSDSMLGSGALGTAALQLVFAAHPVWRSETKCWRGLLQAMRVFARHGDVASPDDRHDAALALIDAQLAEVQQRNAFKRALVLEARQSPWPVLEEFGESSS